MIWFLWACSPPPLPQLIEVPAFQLTDSQGASVGKEQLLGKVWLADFIFTSCPGPCPILSAHMAEIQAHYAANTDLKLVSFSVDPATDTPAVLAQYASRFAANPAQWFFLTGDPDLMKKTIEEGFKQAIDSIPATTTKPATIRHSERFILVDRQGWMRDFPDPAEPGKKRLYAAVDAVLGE